MLAVAVTPGAEGYDEVRRRSLYRTLATELPGLPGVTASAVEIVPLTLSSRSALLLRPGEEIPSRSALPVSAAGVLVGVLGLLTLALAAIGITGVLLYLVRQRMSEIGLRMVLGRPRPG